LAEEVELGHISGPFPCSSVPHAHISRFGVIPKNHQPNKWQLIVDLSHPNGRSVNSGISKELCSLRYITVDDAITQAQSMGRETLLTKIDIKSAFQLLPVHPTDRHLLVIKWKQQLYTDTCLPSGFALPPSFLIYWQTYCLGSWRDRVSPLLCTTLIISLLWLSDLSTQPRHNQIYLPSAWSSIGHQKG